MTTTDAERHLMRLGHLSAHGEGRHTPQLAGASPVSECGHCLEPWPCDTIKRKNAAIVEEFNNTDPDPRGALRDQGATAP